MTWRSLTGACHATDTAATMSVAIDTLVYAQRLREAGFSEQQAEGQAHALAAALEMTDALATKQDLRELGLRVDELDRRLTERLDALDRRWTERLDALDRRWTERFEELERRWTERFDELDRRLTERIETLDRHWNRRFDEQDRRWENRLDARLADLERRMTLRLGGLMAAGIGIMAILQRMP
jgi:exonuclease VII large subunit